MNSETVFQLQETIIKSLKEENEKLRYYYFENLSRYEELIEKYSDLQKEDEKLKKYKKYAEDVGNKRNELYERIDKAIEYIENKIEYLNEQKRMIANILTPQNGYLKADIEIEISKYQDLLNILQGEDND